MNQASTILLPNLEEPIRAELFSLERLEQHGESLAAAQAITSEARRGRPLIPRVTDNGRVLLESYRLIARAIRDEHAITPRPNGWSITSTSSTSSFGRSRMICRQATIACCPSLLRATWRVIRAYSE